MCSIAEGIATGFIENAEAWVIAQPRLQCHIENLDKDSADVVYDPFIKNSAKEFTVLPRCDGARRYILPIEMLNRWNKLHKRCTEVLEVV